MSDRQLAEIICRSLLSIVSAIRKNGPKDSESETICRALLAIVSAIRKKYGLKDPEPYVIWAGDSATMPPEYR